MAGPSPTVQAPEPDLSDDRWAAGRASSLTVARHAGQRTTQSRARRAAGWTGACSPAWPSLHATGTPWGAPPSVTPIPRRLRSCCAHDQLVAR